MTIKRCSKGSIPIVKQFLGENFEVPSKIIPKMALIRGNGGLDIRFCVRDPEKHILGRNRVFWRILRQNPSRALGCSELQEPKITNTFLMRKVTHAQKRYARADRDERLHRCRGPQRNHLCRFV